MPGEVQSVQGAAGCSGSCLKDKTPPPTPSITASMAFERASDRATFGRNRPAPVVSAGRDPAYLELGNVEAGTTFQIVNLSRKPDATFDDAIELSPTGRDLGARTCAIYLTNEQMNELDLKAGDLYLIRAKDADGNVSDAVRGELEPDDWANGFVHDVIDNRWVDARGTQRNFLDGEGGLKNFIVRSVGDARPPVVLEDRLFIETRVFPTAELDVVKALRAGMDEIKKRTSIDGFSKDQLKTLLADDTLPKELLAALKACADADFFSKLDDACWQDRKDDIVGTGDLDAVLSTNGVRVSLKGDQSMEIGATLSIQNQRTGDRFEGRVADDKVLVVNMKNLSAGDPLILSPVDHEGHRGQEIRFTYAPRCDKGRAPITNALGARLPGVIG